MRADLVAHAHVPSAGLGFPSSLARPEWGAASGQPERRAVAYSAGSAPHRHERVGIDVFRTWRYAIEPTLGIHPHGAIFFTAVQANMPPRWLVLRSSDGERWQDVSPALPDRRPAHRISMDGMLYLDDTTGRVFMTDYIGPCAQVAFTDDEGETWDAGAACGLADHQNLFTGPPVTSTTIGYPNVVYYCSIQGGVGQAFSTATGCLKSLDGGRTFVPTGSPPYVDGVNPAPGNFGMAGRCGGTTGHGFVDGDGMVYLPRGWCGQPWLAISGDEGATWRRVQVADNGMASHPGGPADLAASGMDGLQEHEAAVAVDAQGTIYYFYTATNRLPYLVVSEDAGETWSDPVMIGPRGLKEASLPAMDIDARGRIAMAYIGSTDAPGGEAPDGSGPEYEGVTWNGYVTIVDTPLPRRPRFVTAMVHHPKNPLMVGECSVVRCQQQYDFIDVVLDRRGRAWTAMIDGCPPPGACFQIGHGIVGRITVPR